MQHRLILALVVVGSFCSEGVADDELRKKPAMCMASEAGAVMVCDVAALKNANEDLYRQVWTLVGSEAEMCFRQRWGINISTLSSMALVWPNLASSDCVALCRLDETVSQKMIQAAVESKQPGSAWRREGVELRTVWVRADRQLAIAHPCSSWIAVGAPQAVRWYLQQQEGTTERNWLSAQEQMQGSELLAQLAWQRIPHDVFHRNPELFAFAQAQHFQLRIQMAKPCHAECELQFIHNDEAKRAAETAKMLTAMARGMLLKRQHAVQRSIASSDPLHVAPLFGTLAGIRQLNAILEKVESKQQHGRLIIRGPLPEQTVSWLALGAVLPWRQDESATSR